jgi:hypothetical protein
MACKTSGDVDDWRSGGSRALPQKSTSSSYFSTNERFANLRMNLVGRCLDMYTVSHVSGAQKQQTAHASEIDVVVVGELL